MGLLYPAKPPFRGGFAKGLAVRASVCGTVIFFVRRVFVAAVRAKGGFGRLLGAGSFGFFNGLLLGGRGGTGGRIVGRLAMLAGYKAFPAAVASGRLGDGRGVAMGVQIGRAFGVFIGNGVAAAGTGLAAAVRLLGADGSAFYFSLQNFCFLSGICLLLSKRRERQDQSQYGEYNLRGVFHKSP